MNYFLGLILALVLTPVTAAAALVSYDGARLLQEQQQIVNNYVLALSTYEKRENRWQPERALRLQGQLQRTTWELPAGTDEQRVIAFYRQQLPETAQSLFVCEGRDCGESNNWANDHFGIKQLYGLDQYQSYGAYQLDNGDYLSLYIVRRGNRRVYIHIETLTPAPT